MDIKLKKIEEMYKQNYETSCWITVAHFVLKYTHSQIIPLEYLENKYYRPNSESSSLMTGSGNPVKILGDLFLEKGCFAKVINCSDEATIKETLQVIINSIEKNFPVIALMKSRQVQSFAHAVVLIGVNSDGTVNFLDPAQHESNNLLGKAKLLTKKYSEFIAGFFTQSILV